MIEFYKKAAQLNTDCRNIAITVLSGRLFGEKALLSDGGERKDRRIVWQSIEDSFFAEHKTELEQMEIESSGLAEAGGEKLYCEFLGQEKKIVICGGGHVAVPLIQLGRMMGCRVIVLEDRPEFAARAERAKASEVICMPFEKGLEQITGDADTYFVIVTRGHQYDKICLEHIAGKRHAYIGMIGSRKRTALVKASVLEAGAAPDVINRVYTPIGLSIGAQTPEEIAIAIAAEIISIKNQKKDNGGYPREILQTINNEELCNEQKILATIIDRTGSAPRSAGTKMLILPRGRCIGTIGGGYAEAKICQEALSMLREGKQKARLCRIDLTGADVEDEGMVCGGILDVLLEVTNPFMLGALKE